MYKPAQRVLVYDSGEEFVGRIVSVLRANEISDARVVVHWGYCRSSRNSPLYKACFNIETKRIIGQRYKKKEKRKPRSTCLLDDSLRTPYKVGLNVRVHLAERVVEGVIQGVNVRGTGDWLRIIGDNSEVIELLSHFISIPRPDLMNLSSQ